MVRLLPVVQVTGSRCLPARASGHRGAFRVIVGEKTDVHTSSFSFTMRNTSRNGPHKWKVSQ